MSRSISSASASSVPDTPTRRRLSSSSRRGSTSAPDPWARNSLEEPTGSTSRLHIVRLPPPTKEELVKFDKEHGLTRSSSWGASTAVGHSKSMSHDRVSFVGGLSRSGSTTDRPRIHPSSHTGSLAPQQLYDLAMASINPRVSSDGMVPESTPMPAVFTPLPANHYLPFIVRPNEVHQLLSQAPPRRLWALIKQIYPTKYKEESDDPTKWPLWQLERWMFKVDRHEASDRVWVNKARTCISRRSEPLWEKLKNALGVPPELEVDDDLFSDDDEELDAVVGSLHGMKVASTSISKDTVKLPTSVLPVPAVDGDQNGQDEAASVPMGEEETLEDEYSDMGPTGLVMEAIYPSSAPPAIPQSPSKAEEFGFNSINSMDVIGEEEEDEEKADKAGNAGIKLVTENLQEVSAAKPPSAREGPAEIDPTRMVGITFVSHSKHVPLKEYISQDSDSSLESPIFPTNFASLSQAPVSARRRSSSRGSFVLERGSIMIGGVNAKPAVREHAISTGSESDYDGT